MNLVEPSIKNLDLSSCLESKINHLIEGLDRYNQSDNQKILELCQVGKFLCTYFPDFNIVDSREQPDFLIANGSHTFGLEHQSIFFDEVLEITGFFNNIALLAERELEKDPEMPNFLVNCYINKEVEFSNKKKNDILNTFVNVIKQFVVNDIVIDNDLFYRIRKMDHSQKSVNVNFGGYAVPRLSKERLLEAIQRKERKVNDYIKNTECGQWLLLLIGGVGGHSYYLRDKFELELDSEFEKIFLLEDFDNRLYEIK